MCGLYSERYFWVPVYLNGVFGVEMTTIQRNESLNTFFNSYVHPSTTLKKFIDRYDNALCKNVENVSVTDFNSFNSTIVCVSRFCFEKKFQRHTIVKFKKVQEEIKEVMYCSISLIKRECAICTYQVTLRVEVIDIYMKK